jgi:hypothetical protein
MKKKRRIMQEVSQPQGVRPPAPERIHRSVVRAAHEQEEDQEDPAGVIAPVQEERVARVKGPEQDRAQDHRGAGEQAQQHEDGRGNAGRQEHVQP